MAEGALAYPLPKQRNPLRGTVLALSWGWLLALVLVPNLLVLAASLLTRDPAHFLQLPLTLDNLSRIRARWRPLLVFLLILPFWTNSLVRTYAIKQLLAANGPLNGALLALGLIDAPLELLYTQGAVILGLVYLLLPFMILPLYAVFEDLRPELLLASRDLGAGRFATFVHVLIPLTLPGILAGTLLVLLPALCMFYVADILGGARVLLVGNVIKNQFLDARDWPFGAAASILLTAAMALLLFAHRLARRRLNEGDMA